MSLDALLLLSKLEYAVGDYEGALGHLTAAGLDQLTEKTLPTRSLRIVAESYAIKGEVLILFLWATKFRMGCWDNRIKSLAPSQTNRHLILLFVLTMNSCVLFKMRPKGLCEDYRI